MTGYENATRDIYTVGAKGTRQLRCAVVGGGQRGQNYSVYAEKYPHLMKIVAVADPLDHVRKLYDEKYKVPKERQYKDWNELASKDKIADMVMICTQDSMHKEPAVAFANKGYHILLEKPMATTKEDCIAIVEACERNNVMFAVGHVLRYFVPNKKIEEIINNGIIGDVIHISHHEPVGYFHFAHSFVRGNWRDENTSSFSLMTKSCHDIDLIVNWMKLQKNGRDSGLNTCKKISSFGSLRHFKKENKPIGAADRCLDCKVEEKCPYSAVKLYIGFAKGGHWRWPVSAVTEVQDIEELTNRLRTGPYGECVYNGRNNVCDHQTVNMEFEGGQTATFTMIAFTEKLCQRRTHVFGSHGELIAEDDIVKHFDFLTGATQTHTFEKELSKSLGSQEGHGNADFCLFDAFVRAVMFNDPTMIESSPQETLRSHLVVFDAEESRLKGQVVEVKHKLEK